MAETFVLDSESEDEIELLIAELEDKTEKYDLLLTEYQNDMEKAHDLIEAKDNRIRALEGERDKLSRRLHHLKICLDEAQKPSPDSPQQDVKINTDTHNEVLNELEQAKCNYKELLDTCNDLRSENAQLKEQNDQVIEMMEDLRQKYDNVTENLSKAEEIVNGSFPELKRRYELLGKKHECISSRVGGLEMDIKKHESTIANLEAENDSLKRGGYYSQYFNEINSLKVKLEEKDRSIKVFQSKQVYIHSLEQELASLRKEQKRHVNIDFEDRITSLEDKIKSKDDELQNLRTTIQSLMQRRRFM